MPISEKIDAIQALVDDDREALKALLSKYPELDKGFVDAETFQDRENKLALWNDWRAKNWNEEKRATNAQVEAEVEAARLRAENAALSTGAGGDMADIAQVEQYLKEKGYVTKDQMPAAGVATAADVESKLQIQGSNMQYLFSRTLPLASKFQREFPDKDFDVDGFLNFASQSAERIKDMPKAYEEFIAPIRMDKERAAIAAERAQLETQKAEIAEMRTRATLPSDDGTMPSMPPFQQMQEKDNMIDKVRGDLPVGKGALGAHIGRLYNAGQLPSQSKPN